MIGLVFGLEKNGTIHGTIHKAEERPNSLPCLKREGVSHLPHLTSTILESQRGKLEAGIFKPLNASFLSRGKARGRDLHSSCRSRRIGYTAPAHFATGKGHLHNLHSKMDKNLAHKYLQLPAMARKSRKTPNLRQIYKNLREFTPLFEEFTKIYVNLQRKLLRPPALPPFVVGLG